MTSTSYIKGRVPLCPHPCLYFAHGYTHRARLMLAMAYGTIYTSHTVVEGEHSISHSNPHIPCHTSTSHLSHTPHSTALCPHPPHSTALCPYPPHSTALCPYPPHSTALCPHPPHSTVLCPHPHKYIPGLAHVPSFSSSCCFVCTNTVTHRKLSGVLSDLFLSHKVGHL